MSVDYLKPKVAVVLDQSKVWTSYSNCMLFILEDGHDQEYETISRENQRLDWYG